MRVTRDQLVMLWPATRHPEAARVEAVTAAAARRAGVLVPAEEGRFEAFNRLTSYVFPTATVERAAACARWCNWLYFFDDRHDEVDAARPGAAHDLVGAAAAMRGYLDLLADLERDDDGGDPLARYALDFRADALRLGGRAWFTRFLGHVREYILEGTLSACVHWASGSVPRIDEYLVQRDADSAVETAIDLIELAQGIELPAELHADPTIVAMRQALTRTVALFNDVVSYPKEVLRQGNPNNLVHVLMGAGLSYEGALRESIRLVNRCADELRWRGEAAIARYRREVPAIEGFVAGLFQWQRGNIESSLVEARYRAPESPFVELRV